MIRRPPRSTRTDTLFPYTTLVRSTVPRILASAMAALTLPLLGSMAVAALLTPLVPALRDEEKRAAAEKAEVNRYKANCLDPAAIEDLNHMPPTTLLTPIDLGAPLVFWTRHSLVATSSEERRVGQECVSTCRSRWARQH